MKLKHPAILGRRITLLLPNGEKHAAQFAIVELDDVLASHNEKTFANTPGYPLGPNGDNINDRNYAGDANAQASVMEYARNLQPERLVTTSRTPSGTPIITKDFICVSGNNRTMSLKLAKSDFPDRYAEYKEFMIEETGAFGIIWKYRLLPDNGIKHPVLVRIDYDFGEYKTANLAVYNKDTKKGKRPVDRAVELSTVLRENTRCSTVIPLTVAQHERMSDFYANSNHQKQMVDVLLECSIITQQELPNYYTPDYGFTANGKILLESILSGIVLDKEAIMASDTEGVRSFRQHVVTSLPVLMANKEMGADNLLPFVSEAIVLQQKIKGSGLKFADYLAQGSFFAQDSRKWNEKALYLNRVLFKGQRAFKAAISKYNESLNMASQSAGLFGDKPTPKEIFQRYIIDALENSDVRAIKRYLGQDHADKIARLKKLEQKIINLRKKLAA